MLSSFQPATPWAHAPVHRLWRALFCSVRLTAKEPEKAVASGANDGLVIPAGRRCVVAALLGLAFACNAAALVVPFMDVRVGLSRTAYSLPNSVNMLWESGLYLLAVLVVAFSVIFPFAKLLVLGSVCAAKRVRQGHRRWLVAVERLGKWSMLDVFLVCLILTLTSGQLLVGARPLIGIPLFAFAIVLSMISGELLTAAIGHLPGAEDRVPLRPRQRGIWWLALAGLALMGTLFMPFLKISDWALVDHSYSIVGIVPSLWVQDSPVSAVLVSLFLVLFPVVQWALAAAGWRRGRCGQPDNAFRRLAHVLKRWSMLDVFGLALAVFLVEGEYLMQTEVRWGALLLVALIGLRFAVEATLNRVMERGDA
jgi:paraquat-inducible protein A